MASRAGRSPGRPSRISQEQILEAAVALIREGGLDGCNMTQIARRLGVSVMALYTYFPSRDALIEAVAADVFAALPIPSEGGDWRAFLTAWMRTLYDEFIRRPEAIELMYRDDHVPRAWLRLWLPMMRVLWRQGLRGPDLGMASTWLGLVVLQMIAGLYKLRSSAELLDELGIDSLDPGDRILFEDVNVLATPGARRRLAEFTIENIILGIERAIEQAREAGRLAAPTIGS